MTLYEFLKFAHVLAAITWVGTAIEQQIVGARATLSGDPRRLGHFLEEAEWVGVRIMTPAAIAAAALGVALVIVSGWNFSDVWIEIGIGLFVVSALNGMIYLTPQTKKLRAAFAERGQDDPEVRQLMRRVTLATQIDLLILITIVADMVIKPGV